MEQLFRLPIHQSQDKSKQDQHRYSGYPTQANTNNKGDGSADPLIAGTMSNVTKFKVGDQVLVDPENLEVLYVGKVLDIDPSRRQIRYHVQRRYVYADANA